MPTRRTSTGGSTPRRRTTTTQANGSTQRRSQTGTGRTATGTGNRGTGLTQFRPEIRSRHPSHGILRAGRRNLPLFPFRTLIRLGSTTEVDESRYRVVVNSIASIRTSSNKLRMKEAFDRANVNTAPWFTTTSEPGLRATCRQLTDNWAEGQKIVAKAHFGSRGQGNTLISTEAELNVWLRGKSLNQYIFEKYMPYSLEYRLHITADGCFYTCRKALRQDAPESERWRRHDDICVWLLETNPGFNRPNSWNDIVTHCQRALGEVGADVLSFDVKVQGATVNGRARDYQDFIILECNSASSLGSPDDAGTPGVCATKYIEELPRIIRRKANL